MTARTATNTLSRVVSLTATATVSAAAIACASADLFRVPGCSKATVSIPTTEKRALLFQSIERAVHFRDNCFGLIRQRDQFDIDLMVFVSVTA